MLLDSLLNSLVTNHNYFGVVFPFLKSEYFSKKQDRIIVDAILKYHMKYNKIPKFADIALEIDTDYDICQEESTELIKRLKEIEKFKNLPDTKNLIDQTEQYFKDRALEKAINESIEIIEKKGNRGEIETKVKDALAIAFVTKLGHDYFEDVRERMAWYEKEDQKIPLNVVKMNEAIGGGLVRKAMFCFMANTNVGKCSCFDTKVLLSDGSYRNIEYIFKNKISDNVISMAVNHKLTTNPIIDWIDSGILECFELETKDGIYTKPTATHPYYTLDGWKPVSELQIGNVIAIPKQYTIFDNIDNNLKDYEAILLGLLLADGSITRMPGFSNIDNELITLFKKTCLQIDPLLKFNHKKNKTIEVSSSTWRNNSITKWLRSLSLMGLNSHTKSIPNEIFTTSKEKIAKFIGAFWACDGWVSSNIDEFQIGISLCNKEMLIQIRSLLLRFGIKTRILSSTATAIKGGKQFLKYSIIIRDYESIKKFYDNIKIPLSYKQSQLETYILSYKNSNYRSSYSDSYPKELWNHIKYCLISKKMSWRQLGLLISPTKNKFYKRTGRLDYCEAGVNLRITSNISLKLLKEVNIILQDDFLQSIINGDICFDRITKIKPIGKHQCYDLTIKDTHNFVANDMIVHNSIIGSHCASSLVMDGHNVLLLSGEMSEQEMLKRHDANILDISIDTLGPSLDKALFRSRFKEAFDKPHGVLIVKEFPTGTANANHIKNLIHEAWLKKKLKFDVVVLDGLNNFASYKIPASQTGTSLYVKSVAEENRALCMEEDYALLTFAQFNRGAKGKQDKADLEDVARF